MYLYTFSAGNPEGTDWTIRLVHENRYTQEGFRRFCEASIIYSMEKEKKERGYTSKCSIDTEFILEYMDSKGFSSEEKAEQYYYFEPYWGLSSIGRKLRRYLKKVEREDYRQIIKEYKENKKKKGKQ